PAAPRALAAMSGGPTVLGAPSGPAAGGESSGPTLQGYNVPGRNPDSRMPWQLFLGGASHRLIAYRYGVNHPDTRAYFNKEPIAAILGDTGIGRASLLLPDERKLCPDITDITRRVLFEIKPWHEQGLLEGREEARTYLAALNRTLLDGRRFTGGTDFHGEILIRFARGQYIWRLEWRTPEPGITLYRWTRSQQRFESEAAAYEAGQWTDLSVEELRQYGGWVEKAVEDMISRREKLATVSGAVGLVIDLAGEAARVVLWSALMGQMGSSTGARQPPTQGGGQVIPFPARLPPAAPPAQVPAAASMPLPH
ncbi:MAG TPA: hypothetical protein VEZ71_20470, partial [Archangium sp.]|nr:hypothetical protein [Archangium sp.]